MVKLGLVGVESFHAEQFLRIVNKEKKFDAKIVGIWSEPGMEERCRYLVDNYAPDTVYDTLEELCLHVDAVMIVTRNGADHLSQCEPFMKNGLAVWLDKPLALCSDDIKILCARAEKYGIKITGGSTLKHSQALLDLKKDLKEYGNIDYFSLTYCSSLNDTRPGGASFYGMHLAELVYYFLGDDIDSICVHINGDTLIATLDYKNKTTANLVMTAGGFEMTCQVVGDAKYIARKLSIHDCYEAAVRNFLAIIKGEAEPIGADAMYVPVRIMEFIEKAILEPGKKISYR